MDTITITIGKIKQDFTIKGKKYRRIETTDGEILYLDNPYPFSGGTVLTGQVQDVTLLSLPFDFLHATAVEKQIYNEQHILHQTTPCFSGTEQIRYELFVKLCGITGRKESALFFLENYSDTALLEEKIRENPFWFYSYYHNLPRDNFRSLNQTTLVTTFACRLEQLKAGIVFLLLSNEKQGHTYTVFSILYHALCRLMETDGHLPPQKELIEAILLEDNRFYYQNGRVALQTAYDTEERIQDCIKLLCANVSYISLTPTLQDILCEEQRTAVTGIVEAGGCSILTGGPGTGKTTTISSILEYYKEERIALLAPTARAAQRVRESLLNSQMVDMERLQEMKLSTIHKFVGYGLPHFLQSTAIQEAKEITLCIIDEFSMVDIYLFLQLLESLDLCRCKLILVGDANQLPSILAGNLLTDLIHLGVPTFTLTENHRSVKSIYQNAQSILRQERGLIEDEHFLFLPEEELESVLTTIDFSTMETVFLTPYRKPYDKNGHPVLGNATTINQKIHKRRYGEAGISPGDKVMCIHNNYKEQYFNGDVGFCQGFAEEGMYVSFDSDYEEREVLVKEKEDLEYAYACTIHKSQGSEYPLVVLYLPRQMPSGILNKELLYTAITRAKQKVIILGTPETVYTIMQDSAKERRTFLSLKEERNTFS